MVRDDMESGIVTSYKNKGIIIPELISLPFFLRSSNSCLKKLFFRQIFLKSIYFSSCHHSCCQWHKEDLSNSWIKDTRWKVMIILGYWTLHHFHTQTLQSLHLDWWYFLRCGNDFWRIYTDFGVQIWQVKVKLRVLKVATDDFVSVG